MDNGEWRKKEYEGEIKGFEDGVFKVIEYQIHQVFHPNNEEFTLFHRINALNLYAWHLITG